MRVALIGLGEAGAGMHLPALAGLRTAEVVGACDTAAPCRQHAAARFRIPVFADADAMLGEARPDLVIVATPPDTHADLCLRAFAAGAHVLVEKPLAPTRPEADRILAAAARHGRHVAVNHQFREMPIFRALVAEARRPEAGPLRFVQIWQIVDLPPGSETGWRGQLARRTILDAGVHLIDLAMALFDERPASVHASISDAGGASASDAVALVTLEFSAGRLAQITQDRVSPGARHYFEVRADTPAASLRASFGGRSRLTAGFYHSTRPHLRFEYGASGLAWREAGNARTFLARNGRHPLVTATRTVIEATIEAFGTGRRAPTDGTLARDVLEVVDAAYLSAETDGRIRLDAHDESAHARGGRPERR